MFLATLAQLLNVVIVRDKKRWLPIHLCVLFPYLPHASCPTLLLLHTILFFKNKFVSCWAYFRTWFIRPQTFSEASSEQILLFNYFIGCFFSLVLYNILYNIILLYYLWFSISFNEEAKLVFEILYHLSFYFIDILRIYNTNFQYKCLFIVRQCSDYYIKIIVILLSALYIYIYVYT